MFIDTMYTAIYRGSTSEREREREIESTHPRTPNSVGRSYLGGDDAQRARLHARHAWMDSARRPGLEGDEVFTLTRMIGSRRRGWRGLWEIDRI
jgi:hypothetical protein